MARIEKAYAAYDRWGEARKLPRASRIYVNRNLKMSSISAIGFDLDHTLALYKGAAIESLAFEETKKKLVEDHGFPEEILNIRYNPRFVIRGLVVDRRYGNLIKMNGHNYVTRAYHGTGALPDEDRRRIYSRRRLRISHDAYVPVDTLFHLPEAYLYQALVDLGERGVRGVTRDQNVLYGQVRESIDKAHADGSIKRVVVADPETFLQVDRSLAPTFERFRETGKKLFLLTNSDLAYTDVVLSYVFGTPRRFDSWRDAFDLVFVEAGKPAFFLEEGTGGISSGRLGIRRSGAKVLRGGNAAGLELELGHLGDEVLYFGDHTFGDILRSKKSLGWRTAMVVPELKRELRVTQRISADLNRLANLNRDLDFLRVERGRLQRGRRRNHRSSGRAGAGRASSDGVEGKRIHLAEQWAMQVHKAEALGEECDRAFNPYWGSLFREGRETSYFGQQVKGFACIYTSRVSNFIHYPVDHYFQAPGDLMPHEL